MVAGSAFAYPGISKFQESEEEETKKIKKYRRLGRTGFMVSDISMGAGGIKESNVVRYAYDNGINYFDTAEGYGNGDSERKIGEAMQHMDRKKIFITTKLPIRDNDNEKTILERFAKCLERLQTEYVDCLYMHSVKKVDLINHSGFHSAVKQLKADGVLRYAGISSHGPSNDKQDSMEAVLTKAAEDGRFDVMLFNYNFLNKEAAENILKACKKNDVGTTAMKISPGYVTIDDYDPANPNEDQKKSIERQMKRGRSEEEAQKRLQKWTGEQQEELVKYKPFFEKYNITTKDQLQKATIQWVLQNEDMQTICVSLNDFDIMDSVLPLSGTKLSSLNRKFMNEYGQFLDKNYCRHGCNECSGSCPHDVPVSKIMRYAYYYSMQGREKFAMQKYRKLSEAGNMNTAAACTTCDAPCLAACPHNLNVQAHLDKAHSLLTLT